MKESELTKTLLIEGPKLLFLIVINENVLEPSELILHICAYICDVERLPESISIHYDNGYPSVVRHSDRDACFFHGMKYQPIRAQI